MSGLLKNIVIIVGLLLLVLLGYYLFVIERNSTLQTGVGTAFGQAELETQEFLLRLEELQKITISTAVFQDPRFRSLTDFSTVVEQVPAGRSTPFAEPN